MHDQAPATGVHDRSLTRRRVVLKKLGVLSVAKVFGLVYAAIGLLIGGIFSIFSIVGSLIGVLAQGDASPLLGLFFGAGAIIIAPIFYGVMGFIVTALGAAIYNLVAGLVGGIEVEIMS